MTTALEVKNLKKAYKTTQALKGVDLALKSGQIVGLAGHNGCGKSTLIKCILGLVIPDQGQITIDEKSILSEYEYRRQIGYMPQNADFPSNLTSNELFHFLQELRGVKATRLDELITLFDIKSILNRKTSELSGGTKQRVAAVIAGMFDSKILILDEPTAGLDPVTSLTLKDFLIAERKNDKAILLVSHIMSEIEQMVTHLYFLNEGLVELSGDVELIKEKTKSKNLELAVVQLMKGNANV